jgi:DNA-directed RNA polymerase subunit RPC12/RpoP
LAIRAGIEAVVVSRIREQIMPIPVACSRCAKRFTAPDAAAGKKGTCPNCRQPIVVPHPGETADRELFAEIDAALGATPQATEIGIDDTYQPQTVTSLEAPSRRQSKMTPARRGATHKVECTSCGATHRVALTDNAQYLRCDRCDDMLVAPSEKAYDYQTSRDRRSLLLAGVFVAAAGMAFLLWFQHTSAYLKSPESVAFWHVQSTVKLDVALASANAGLKVLSTMPRCVESRDEHLFLFRYELYFAERPDLERVMKYVLVENKEGIPKTLEMSAGFPPSGW